MKVKTFESTSLLSARRHSTSLPLHASGNLRTSALMHENRESNPRGQRYL